LIAYRSLLAGFEDYLRHDNDGRPIVFIGHSQGAVVLIRLLARKLDDVPALRKRLVLAIILGGDVEVRTGSVVGGSFRHIPLCTRTGETGCVIAYSSFPSEPPPSALFGRPGQGAALQSGATRRAGLAVACVNPAALGGGSAALDPFFPSTSGAVPWVEYPGLYRARCKSAGGATWLQVGKATGAADRRPIITALPDWGYHVADVNLALGNLVADVAAAERAWPAR
jgi:pimeloyl-ACP methyl ester carboxylesterase